MLGKPTLGEKSDFQSVQRTEKCFPGRDLPSMASISVLQELAGSHLRAPALLFPLPGRLFSQKLRGLLPLPLSSYSNICFSFIQAFPAFISRISTTAILSNIDTSKFILSPLPCFIFFSLEFNLMIVYFFILSLLEQKLHKGRDLCFCP